MKHSVFENCMPCDCNAYTIEMFTHIDEKRIFLTKSFKPCEKYKTVNKNIPLWWRFVTRWFLDTDTMM